MGNLKATLNIMMPVLTLTRRFFSRNKNISKETIYKRMSEINLVTKSESDAFQKANFNFESLPVCMVDRRSMSNHPWPSIFSKELISHCVFKAQSIFTTKLAKSLLTRKTHTNRSKFSSVDGHLEDMTAMGINLIRAISKKDREMVTALTSRDLGISICNTIEGSSAKALDVEVEFKRLVKKTQLEELVAVPLSAEDSWLQALVKIESLWECKPTRRILAPAAHSITSGHRSGAPTAKPKVSNTVTSIDLLLENYLETRIDYFVFETNPNLKEFRWRIVSNLETIREKQ